MTFALLPFNNFDEDPSMVFRDAAELSTWVPVEAACRMRSLAVEEICRTLDTATIYFIGDSLARHTYTAFLLAVRGNELTGAMLNSTPPAQRSECSGLYMFTEKVCRKWLDRNVTICNGRVEIQFLEHYKLQLSTNIHQAVQTLRQNAATRRSIVFLSLGLHDGLDSTAVQQKSTVVWGYVGNKTAVFPLQVHGFDVSPINTVQFSNHTEYGHFKGQVLNDADLADLVSGLRTNNLLNFSHVLTGYIGSRSFLEKVVDVVKELKDKNPHLTYVCDPVMGDGGHLYVPADLVEPYRNLVVSQADILTPNQFELELLTESKVGSEDEALAAMGRLHEKGVKTVVLSSSDLGQPGMLVALASTESDGAREVYRLAIPSVDATFVGTGDLFACSLLIWLQKDRQLKDAFEKTVATVQAVMARTLDYARGNTAAGQKPSMADMELQLVQSKADIENPVVKLKAAKV
nr:hypothetical protein BaRGS_004160 [Batillaria attramentaria]